MGAARRLGCATGDLTGLGALAGVGYRNSFRTLHGEGAGDVISAARAGDDEGGSGWGGKVGFDGMRRLRSRDAEGNACEGVGEGICYVSIGGGRGRSGSMGDCIKRGRKLRRWWGA
jgi:hypothetical protein